MPLFPAHAGMNRNQVQYVRSFSSVPRPCGDEPAARQVGLFRVFCSPPMRG